MCIVSRTMHKKPDFIKQSALQAFGVCRVLGSTYSQYQLSREPAGLLLARKCSLGKLKWRLS